MHNQTRFRAFRKELAQCGIEFENNTKKIEISELSTELRIRIDAIDQPIESYYRTFNIPKRGRRGSRKISAPSKELKDIQREILSNFNSRLHGWIKDNIFGFVKGKTIADNAMYHVTELSHNKALEFLSKHDETVSKFKGAPTHQSIVHRGWIKKQKIIAKKYRFIDITLAKVKLSCYRKDLIPKSAVRIDIRDAFASISPSIIRMALKKHTSIPLEDIERIIAVCTLNGGLPQGAPTSPILLNFALIDFDNYCYHLMQKKIGQRFSGKLKYSRYADDIVISSLTPGLAKRCINLVRSVARLYDLRINDKKTRIMSTPTGIFINGINIINGFDHICISRKQRAKIRAAINQAALISNKNSLAFKKLKQQIVGRISYVNSLDNIHGTRLLKYAVERGVLDRKLKFHGMPLDLKILATSKYIDARSKVY